MSRLGAQRIGMEGMEKEVTARVSGTGHEMALMEDNQCCGHNKLCACEYSWHGTFPSA